MDIKVLSLPLPLPLLLFFLLLLACPLSGYRLVDKVQDRLMAEEGRVYVIETSRHLVVAMVSDEGDADMYVSTTHKKPSFDKYEYSSTSCGLDVLVVPTSDGIRKKVYVGVYGHVRYENTSYQLYILEPEEVDVRRYQVWDWDPGTNQPYLLMDVDPLILANDPHLHHWLDAISGKGAEQTAGEAGYVAGVRTVFEWVGYVLLEILKIVIEILA